MQKGVARPDLLAATGVYLGDSKSGSLMEEIVDKEGLSSPLLRMERVLQPSPFLRSARVGSMRGKRSRDDKSRAARSASLPDLSDLESLEASESSALAPPPAPSNRFSVLLPTEL